MSKFVRADGRVIHPQTSLTKEQKEAVGLLSIGTFLEYFDLMLYVHMAVLLNELFFEPTDPHTASLITAASFCSTYLLRPFGAIIFGYIGDNVGRKTTVVITTFLMGLSCFTMANLPTYAQIGITASIAITICRIIQGMSSMGEITAAQLYLTETIDVPIRYPAVATINLFVAIGTMASLGIASLVTTYGFNWRMAFWFGACIALLGAVATTRLRETTDFVNAKHRVQLHFKKFNQDSKNIKNHPIIQEKASIKTSVALLLLDCMWPLCFYFAYVHCANILKYSFNYTAEQIIHNNLIVSIVQVLSCLILAFLLCYIYPLIILKIKLVISSVFLIASPYWINTATNAYEILLMQSLIIFFACDASPVNSIFLKHFPVFKRFTYTSVIYALSRALVYVITSFSFVYLVEYFGNWGILFVVIPIIIGFILGLSRFEKLEKERGVLY
ncbi:MFS transporter [Candidatus Tisiphia endosymbiont of Micropterix aruncella]|uniref:MFS transporter n=1 Tax=Candidatus Tisiphia endosymbiont of Micropterix aruncella TaxID=3066271 RepID=UPI003AA86E4C